MYLDGFSYINEERPFVDYFNRLRSIAMSKNDILNLLPQLERYYKEMVNENEAVHWFFRSSYKLRDLFDEWSRFYSVK